MLTPSCFSSLKYQPLFYGVVKASALEKTPVAYESPAWLSAIHLGPGGRKQLRYRVFIFGQWAS
jgi:hypothetical protein